MQSLLNFAKEALQFNALEIGIGNVVFHLSMAAPFGAVGAFHTAMPLSFTDYLHDLGQQSFVLLLSRYLTADAIIVIEHTRCHYVIAWWHTVL